MGEVHHRNYFWGDGWDSRSPCTTRRCQDNKTEHSPKCDTARGIFRLTHTKIESYHRHLVPALGHGEWTGQVMSPGSHLQPANGDTSYVKLHKPGDEVGQKRLSAACMFRYYMPAPSTDFGKNILKTRVGNQGLFAAKIYAAGRNPGFNLNLIRDGR